MDGADSIRSPAKRAGARRPAGWTSALALGAVLALAFWVRAAPASRVLAPTGVVLAADGDPYYHALRAERIARQWPSVPWTDRGMNHPYGADIPWPPLLDQMIATAAVARGTTDAEGIARASAWLPPFLGLAVVAVVAALAAALVAAPAWPAALLAAVLPAAARQSVIGRADHHVLEVLLAASAFLALVRASRGARGSRIWIFLMGSALALSFWNWSGSALNLLLLFSAVAALHVVLPAADGSPRRAASALAGGSALAAASLLVSILAWGPPGALRSLRLTPITALSVVLCALTALAACALALARRLDPAAGAARRALHVAGAAIAPALALTLLPGLQRSGIAHGLSALGASSAWYEAIAEFWPLIFSGRQSWIRELGLVSAGFGLAPALALPAILLARRDWRVRPQRRPEIVLFATWAAGLCAMALLRRRFEGYAIVPIAVLVAWTASEAAGSMRPWVGRWRGLAPAVRLAVCALALAPCAALVARGGVLDLPDGIEERAPLLRWLRDLPAPEGRAGVLSTWTHGHEIQWIARKPVVSNPFGTDIDPRSLRDEMAFFTALEPSAADEILERRAVGFLLLENPVREVATLHPLAPGSPAFAIEERSAASGARYAMHPEFFELVASRLFFFDGGRQDGEASSLSGFRLLAESRASVEVLGFSAQRYKLFGVVAGASVVVRGAQPSSVVSATARIHTNAGRSFRWTGRAIADANGRTALILPYATGANGWVRVEPYLFSDGTGATILATREDEIGSGTSLEIELGP